MVLPLPAIFDSSFSSVSPIASFPVPVVPHLQQSGVKNNLKYSPLGIDITLLGPVVRFSPECVFKALRKAPDTRGELERARSLLSL